MINLFFPVSTLSNTDTEVLVAGTSSTVKSMPPTPTPSLSGIRMVPETARPTPTPNPTPTPAPTPSTCGIEVVPETAHPTPTPTQLTSAIDVVPETDPRPTPTPSTSSGIRVIPETATSFASLNSSIISDTGNDKFLSNDMDSTLGGKKLATSSFKRPSSPVKFTEKKSKKFDDFGDDDDEDLFNFDEPEPEVETSQRKRKRSDDDVNKEQQPSKKKNVKSPLSSPSPPPISAVKEEIPKSVKVVKKTNGFLSKSLFSNSALSTATSVKSDIPAEDMTRSFIKLELRSLVAKKPNSSINISANSPQENLSNGNVKNVKRFRKQVIAQTNSPVLCITNVSARTILEHFDDAPAQGNLLRGIVIWSGAA